jgi:hypothetical protein
MIALSRVVLASPRRTCTVDITTVDPDASAELPDQAVRAPRPGDDRITDDPESFARRDRLPEGNWSRSYSQLLWGCPFARFRGLGMGVRNCSGPA